MASDAPLLHVPEVPVKPARSFFALLVLQSLSFFLTFAAFNAAQSLDGSIPAPPGLAPFQFMAIYVVFAIFAIPAPKLLSYVGPKASMALGMAPYVSLTASFLAPPMCADGVDAHCWSIPSIWALRLTTAVLIGLGAPVLWTGQGVYLARLAAHEARRGPAAASEEERAERLSQTLKRFNGLFFSAFQLSGATGLVGSSLVLVLVQSSSATTYLFLGLSALCAAGLACVILLLPALPPVADADADAEDPAVAEGAAAAEPPAKPPAPAEGAPEVTILSTLHLWCPTSCTTGCRSASSGTCTTPSSSTRRLAPPSSALAARRATWPTRSPRRP